MSLQSFGYFAFLPLVAALLFLLPARWQNPLLLAASFYFYCLALPTGGGLFYRLLPLGTAALALGWVYGLGLAIGRAPAGSRRRSRLVAAGVIGLLALLAFFKYCGLSPLPTLLRLAVLRDLPFPLGLSFFTFAAIGYLIDLGRGDIGVEQSPVDLAVFLFFFATITSGPICRAGQLLPQLKQARRFDAARTVDALRLFALGLFKKVAVADLLCLFVNEVYAAPQGFGGPALILATLAYTLQLYFDFSGYSEMARASGLLLGIQLPENFKTPFYATNFSGFWARWHISLSSWLQDYLFMPLAWADISRLTRGRRDHLPAPLCVFIVFFLSGFWHGSTAPFVVWGLLQGLYRAGEELLHQRLGKPKKKAPQSQIRAKRAGVFALWSLSMVFFRAGSSDKGLSVSLAVLGGFFGGWSPARFGGEVLAAVRTGFYDNSLMVLAYFGLVLAGLALALWLDHQRFARFKSKPMERVLAAQPTALRWALYYALVLLILTGLICQNGGFGGGVSFAYANY